MWSKAVAEDNLESAEKPGMAADVWSVGCIVTEVCMREQRPCVDRIWEVHVSI